MPLLRAMSSNSKLAARQPGQSCDNDAAPRKGRKKVAHMERDETETLSQLLRVCLMPSTKYMQHVSV
ncbi:hypothetical protein GQ55_7G246700 [Panicum hallii var. hallii]|uniref:Uncharacterized protein n=1 Tax=Panicum hallii var. hallii TaxID=1504633 RepID=A0A2T7CYR0_9POAL|nr:hypothetical protein GQ55_7G246700 [Panicum hallii var. hallii]